MGTRDYPQKLEFWYVVYGALVRAWRYLHLNITYLFSRGGRVAAHGLAVSILVKWDIGDPDARISGGISATINEAIVNVESVLCSVESYLQMWLLRWLPGPCVGSLVLRIRVLTSLSNRDGIQNRKSSRFGTQEDDVTAQTQHLSMLGAARPRSARAIFRREEDGWDSLTSMSN